MKTTQKTPQQKETAILNRWSKLITTYRRAARGSDTRKRIEAMAYRDGVYIGDLNV